MTIHDFIHKIPANILMAYSGLDTLLKHQSYSIAKNISKLLSSVTSFLHYVIKVKFYMLCQ
jgi:hypothetical protein